MDLTVVVGVMIKLFLILGLGYFMMKKDFVDDATIKKLNRIVLSITTPALIFASVFGDNEASMDVVIYVTIVSAIFYLVLPIVAVVLIKGLRIKKYSEGLFIFMTIFSNTGFIGYPVMQSIFGNTAVFYTAIFNLWFSLELYTLGVVLLNQDQGGKISFSFRQLLSPGVVAAVASIVLFFTKLPVPSLVENTAAMVGNMTTPLAMIIIGANLALIDVREVFNEFVIYPFTFVKQVILPIAAYPIIAFFIKDPLILGITLVNLAMPVGNSAVLFATQYNHNVGLAAKTVFITTLISIFTIPLVVGLFLT